MRRGIWVTAALLSALAAPTHADGAEHNRCGPAKGVQTVARSPHVRVYSRDVNREYSDEEWLYYYACERPGGRPIKMARIDENVDSGAGATDETIPDFVFSGRVVAFAKLACTSDDCESVVKVFDVRRRKLVRSARFPGRAETVVVSSRGLAAALVSYRYSDHDPDDASVFEIGHDETTELDRGSGLDDLTLSESVAHWLHGAEPRSATLH